MEEAHRWFEIAPGTEFPYKTSVVNVRPEMRESLPAVTHVNGSAHLQTVSVKDNPDFHALLVAVGRDHGTPNGAKHQLQCKGNPSSIRRKKPSKLFSARASRTCSWKIFTCPAPQLIEDGPNFTPPGGAQITKEIAPAPASAPPPPSQSSLPVAHLPPPAASP